MKKHILMIGAASLLAMSTLAQADAKKPLAQWTCEDFLAVNESFQPVAVGLGEAVNKSGKVEDAVLDVDGVAKVTPEVITACQQDKKSHLRAQNQRCLEQGQKRRLTSFQPVLSPSTGCTRLLA